MLLFCQDIQEIVRKQKAPGATNSQSFYINSYRDRPDTYILNTYIVSFLRLSVKGMAYFLYPKTQK